jgi:hypothetical protein
MKTLIATLALILALALPAAATDVEREYVDELVTSTIEAYNASDHEAYEAGIAELEATTADPNTAPQCAGYAELGATFLLVNEQALDHPDNAVLASIVANLLDYAPTAGNDCLLAL